MTVADANDDVEDKGDAQPTPPAPWRHEKTEGLPAASKVSPRRRVAIGVLAFLATGLVTYGTLLWLRPLPRPVLFTWGPSEYPLLPFGSVRFASQDFAAFAEANWFTQKPLQLAALRDAGPQETIVLRLTGRAMYDAHGRVHLLADEAEPGSKKGRQPLGPILEELAKSPAKHKFVLIDLFWPSDDPYLADLAHDLPGRVIVELEAVPDANRLALLSCQTGQVPLISPDLGRSVFGHYVDDGLRGWADFDDAPLDSRGQVTARNLAHFVQARVDRWALANRQTRQTPILVGDGPDFPLVALAKGQPLEHRAPAAAMAYPGWLLSGWKVREQWQREDRPRNAAWLARQLDTVLLQAERDWAGGGDPKKIDAVLRMEIDRLEKTYAPLAKAPVPEPHSLAQAGVSAEPALVKSLHDLVKKIDVARRKTPKADEAEKEAVRLIEDFTPALAPKSDLALSASLFAAALQDPFPRRGTLQLFDRILIERQPEPRYEETLIIHRLAEMANGLREEQWPVRPVRKALELTRRAVLANNRPMASSWLRESAEAAAQKRHDAEFLLFARGYVSVADAEKALDEALTAYDLLLAKQDTLERGQRVLDEAFADLPWLARVLQATEADDQGWLLAAQLVDDLAGVLLPDDPAERAKPRLEEINQRSQDLQTLLTALRYSFAPKAIAELIKQAKGPDGNAGHYVDLESLLLVPWYGAAERAEIWAACRDLGAKLAKQTADRDLDDKQKRPESPMRFGDAARFLRREGERVFGRFRRGVALLQLTGVKADQIEALRRKVDPLLPGEVSRDPLLAIHRLEEAVQETWTQFLPLQWNEEAKANRRERLARVWPGWLRPSGQTNALVQATAGPQRQMQTQQWGWLGDLFRFQSRDPDAPQFFARATFALRDFTPPPGAHVVLPAKATPLEITPAKPALKAEIPVRFVGGPFVGATDATIIQADNEWLRVSLDKTRLTAPDAKKATTDVVPLEVSATLQPGAELSTAPRPLGFLVRVQNGVRSSYHKVILPYLPNPERVELVLSSNPQQPAAPFADLRLRPSKGKQSFFVFVRNGGDKTRTLQAELRVKQELIPGGAVTVTVAPRQTARIPFPGIPQDKLPKKDKDEPPGPVDLPPLQGPLQLRVVDKETNEVLAEREVKVTQASPREYVRVPSISFVPAGPEAPKNRLEMTVRAGAALTGPPCVVELSLPPSRIPGLKFIRDGVFRGELTAPGQEIKLYASDLDFEPGTDEDGVAYLTIDGIPRAIIFRVTYARFGEPTTPREDDRPALRIVSDRYFRTGSRWEGKVEVDNPPTGSRLELSLGRYSDGAFEAQMKQAPMPPRQQGIGFGIRAADGALEFEPFTRDWLASFDSVPVRGERVIHARLLTEKEQDVVPRVDHVVIFDDQVPDRVAFVDLPKQAQLGQPLVVQATGQDKGAGLQSVTFFVGAPSDDKKIPPTAAKSAGEPVPEKNDLYAGKLQMPSDKKGNVEIGVQFTNRVGLSAFAKGTVELVDFDPVKNAPGAIQGNLYEGDIGQKGLTVVLLDAKGNKLAEQKAAADGAFLFENLPPGKYVLVAEKPAAGQRRRAIANVPVEPGQTARVRLELTL
jgi:hypothetical protein